MPRPAKKTDKWTVIRTEWEQGAKQSELCKKYKVSPAALTLRKQRECWELNPEQALAVRGFKDSVRKCVSEYSEANETQRKVIERSMNDTLIRISAQSNNLQLVKMAQGIIVRDKEQINYSNIRTLTGAVKDLDTVINPRTPQIQVNTQVNSQITETVTDEEAVLAYQELIK